MHCYSSNNSTSTSALFFTEEKDSTYKSALTIGEVYHLPINAELTVLGACNTGNGKIAKGEGVMSLARAFRYAGSKNVVTSLWQVDDESTKEIMETFYYYLKMGKEKNRALQLARSEFLEKAKNPHPYFWGAFILIGDNSPINIPISTSNWLGIVISMVIASSFILVILKINTRRKGEDITPNHIKQILKAAFGVL